MKLTKSLLNQDTLLHELGLTSFSQTQQSELFALMMDILEIKVLDCLLSELSDEEKKEFTIILLGESTDEAKKYLNKHVKNLDQKLTQVVKTFKEELQSDIDSARKELLKK